MNGALTKHVALIAPVSSTVRSLVKQLSHTVKARNPAGSVLFLIMEDRKEGKNLCLVKVTSLYFLKFMS